MTKPGLGRGLGRLMNGDPVAGRPGNGKDTGIGTDGGGAEKKAPIAPVPFGKGLNTLLVAGGKFGGGGETRAGAYAPAGSQAKACGYGAAAESTAASKVLLPSWFFYSADILLLSFCIAVYLDAPKPLEFGHLMFCAASVWLGAALSIVGVLRSE